MSPSLQEHASLELRLRLRGLSFLLGVSSNFWKKKATNSAELFYNEHAC